MSFNPNQPRDQDGKWTDAGGTTHRGPGAKSMSKAHDREKSMEQHQADNHAKLLAAKDRTPSGMGQLSPGPAKVVARAGDGGKNKLSHAENATINRLVAEHNAMIRAKAAEAAKNDPHRAHYEAKIARGWKPR